MDDKVLKQIAEEDRVLIKDKVPTQLDMFSDELSVNVLMNRIEDTMFDEEYRADFGTVLTND